MCLCVLLDFSSEVTFDFSLLAVLKANLFKTWTEHYSYGSQQTTGGVLVNDFVCICMMRVEDFAMEFKSRTQVSAIKTNKQNKNIRYLVKCVDIFDYSTTDWVLPPIIISNLH